MYAKIFTQIYDGTLCTKGPWQALVTFQQFLVLADQDGCVDMTAGAISRRTTIPLEIINIGIEELLKVDPESRTPKEDGKRIIPLCEGRSWGWKIVNYKHYRQIKREEDRREYHREYWHKRKEKLNTLNTLNPTQPNQPIAEAEAEAEEKSKALVASNAGRPLCPHEKIIELYHSTLPELPAVKVWHEKRQNLLQARWREEEKRQSLDFWERFFRYVRKSAFLMGENERKWQPDLAWMLNQTKFTEIIEGKFHAGQ